MDTDATGCERAARRVRLALVEQVVSQVHRTPQEEESIATLDDPCVYPELIIREDDVGEPQKWMRDTLFPNLLLWQIRRCYESSRS